MRTAPLWTSEAYAEVVERLGKAAVAPTLKMNDTLNFMTIIQ
jgi:hypothetical protein